MTGVRSCRSRRGDNCGESFACELNDDDARVNPGLKTLPRIVYARHNQQWEIHVLWRIVHAYFSGIRNYAWKRDTREYHDIAEQM